MNDRKETVLDRVKAAEALAAATPPDLEAVAESIGAAPADAQPETPKPTRNRKPKADA